MDIYYIHCSACVFENYISVLIFVVILVNMLVEMVFMLVETVVMVFLEMVLISMDMTVITLIPVQDSSSPPHCRSSNTQTPPNHT